MLACWLRLRGEQPQEQVESPHDADARRQTEKAFAAKLADEWMGSSESGQRENGKQLKELVQSGEPLPDPATVKSQLESTLTAKYGADAAVGAMDMIASRYK